eukprot:9207461-Alexandrium_andersonii.AAC.1
MSASLVGSEMCIRDRNWSTNMSFGILARTGSRAIAREPVSPMGLLGRGPVSYTHLTLPTICSV